ncbi:arylsulfatase [Aureliella helgolandensis]|uniref:Arylsulfatase n=1 Tax=Aureliella helgolandensis TaxID=2527968 RepID=A0A518G1R0_9BACT|nr:arylsulfatase [Aureliella helgolandensis]QDV22532.1 Arylsulfatase [Aureliella helgolandensis]
MVRCSWLARLNRGRIVAVGMAWGLLLLTTSLVNAQVVPSQTTDASATPNLIYIMVDDLGYGDLGCFGQTEIKTPNLDRMASEGMKLTSYYAGCTVCRPSRLSLWTGKHMGHTPIDSNAAYVFRPEDVTVAELLQQSGYATGGVGKWAMGGIETTGHPNRNGFDFWMGYLDQGDAHNYYPTHLWKNDQKIPLAGNVIGDYAEGRGRVASQRTTYSHDVMTEQAFEFVRRHAHDPFLLHVHWTIPHANNEGGRVTGNGMEVPTYGIYAQKDWPDVEKGQAAMITRMDADVGRLLGLLRELGIADHTLVIFTSDNGPHHEGGHNHEYFDANGPLRGYKRDLYDGGIRAPTIAWWPDHVQAGSVNDIPLAAYDWLPTACQFAGVTPPEQIDGISYLPTLLGMPQPAHDYLFWSYEDKRAVRQGKWKALIPGKGKPLELYDLQVDIGEQHDLAADFPEVVRRMQDIIAEAYVPKK